MREHGKKLGAKLLDSAGSTEENSNSSYDDYESFKTALDDKIVACTDAVGPRGKAANCTTRKSHRVSSDEPERLNLMPSTPNQRISSELGGITACGSEKKVSPSRTRSLRKRGESPP